MCYVPKVMFVWLRRPSGGYIYIYIYIWLSTCWLDLRRSPLDVTSREGLFVYVTSHQSISLDLWRTIHRGSECTPHKWGKMERLSWWSSRRLGGRGWHQSNTTRRMEYPDKFTDMHGPWLFIRLVYPRNMN